MFVLYGGGFKEKDYHHVAHKFIRNVIIIMEIVLQKTIHTKRIIWYDVLIVDRYSYINIMPKIVSICVYI